MAPELATAATSSGPEISGPKGACTIPYSNPSIPFHPISSISNFGFVFLLQVQDQYYSIY